MKVTGIDSSLTSAGVAQIAWRDSPNPMVTLDRVQSKGTKFDTIAQRSIRLRTMAGRITGLAVGSDLVVIEGPSFASSGGSGHDRSGLWWLIVARLTGMNLPVVEVPPTTLKVYATGRGRVDKDEVLAAVIKRYAHAADVTGNDVADALALAAIGMRHLGVPIEPSLPETHTRALKGIKFPPIPTRQEQ